jgi:hypothetical protein
METIRIRDPGWKKVGSWIRDKHPGSATLGIGNSSSGKLSTSVTDCNLSKTSSPLHLYLITCVSKISQCLFSVHDKNNKSQKSGMQSLYLDTISGDEISSLTCTEPVPIFYKIP